MGEVTVTYQIKMRQLQIMNVKMTCKLSKAFKRLGTKKFTCEWAVKNKPGLYYGGLVLMLMHRYYGERAEEKNMRHETRGGVGGKPSSELTVTVRTSRTVCN